MAGVILVCLVGLFAISRLATDILLPQKSIFRWLQRCSGNTSGNGAAEDMQNRGIAIHERQMATLVDDVSRMEANSYNGVGVIKVYLHEGADVTRAVSQLGSKLPSMC